MDAVPWMELNLYCTVGTFTVSGGPFWYNTGFSVDTCGICDWPGMTWGGFGGKGSGSELGSRSPEASNPTAKTADLVPREKVESIREIVRARTTRQSRPTVATMVIKHCRLSCQAL